MPPLIQRFFALYILVIVTISNDITERIVYGNDDRIEIYRIQDPNINRFVRATAGIVYRTLLSQDGTGNVLIDVSNFTKTVQGCSLCKDEPFYGESTAPWCSAFLVKPDLMATAGHCVSDEDCRRLRFVFGFNLRAANETYINRVAEEDVYECQDIVDYRNDYTADWALIKLDRNVTSRIPVPIRSEGEIARGTPLFMVGHPYGLPAKVVDNGVVKAVGSRLSKFSANMDAYAGNSGSMAVNKNTYLVEGIMIRGNRDFIEQGNCCKSYKCSDVRGCSGGFEVFTKVKSLNKFL